MAELTQRPCAYYFGAPRVALLTRRFRTAGRVQTVARWLHNGPTEAGFEVTVFNLANSRSDSNSRRILAPATWFRRSLIAPCTHEPDVFDVGTNAVELEPARYLPRRQLTNRLQCFTLELDSVCDAFAQYDAFLFPTLGENLGHVIAESLSAGCPVVCSRSTPWTRVLSRGGGAALASLDFAVWAAEIARRASQPAKARTVAKNAALESYGRRRSRAKYRSAIESALEGLPQPRSASAECSLRRIALLTQGYQSAGGVQTVARWLVTGLRAAGFIVEVFDLASSRTDPYSRRLASPSTWFRGSILARDPVEPDVTHVGANAAEFEPARYLPRLELRRELRRYDAVQVVAGGPTLALAALGSKRPVVLQVATTVAAERAARSAAARFRPVAIWRRLATLIVTGMEPIALRTADAVFVENDAMRQRTLSAGQPNVIVAPPGVNTNVFKPRTSGWDPEGYLLSVCRLDDPRKGLDRLIRAFGLMKSREPSTPDLLLAGRGTFPGDLRALVSRLQLDSWVTVRSDVPPGELPSLYQGASIYLQASHEEGLGLSVLEAMASGLPVVATRTEGTSETVAHAQSGWLVEQDADVEAQIAQRATSVRDHDGPQMSVRARQRAETLFSSEATLRPFLEMHRRLLQADPPE